MERVTAMALGVLLGGCSLTTTLDDLATGDSSTSTTSGSASTSSGSTASSGVSVGPGGSGGVGSTGGAAAASGGAGGSTGGAGGVEGDCVAQPTTYEILDVGAVGPPGINGYCNGPTWSVTPHVDFQGFVAPGWNNGDPICTLAWLPVPSPPGSPPLLYGCCIVIDASMLAPGMSTDDAAILTGDAIRLLFGKSLVYDDSTVDIALDIHDPPFARDVSYPGGAPDPTLDLSPLGDAMVSGTVNSDAIPADIDYVVEWKMELPYMPALDTPIPCDLVLLDADKNEPFRERRALGGCPDPPSPEGWGRCIFSSKQLTP